MAWKNKETKKEYLREYYLKNKEKVRQKSKESYLRNKEEINKRIREYGKTDHGKATRAAKKFNISYEEAKRLIAIKECQICGDNRLLAIDHCHVCGEVRGRLCYRCNRAIGAFGDSAEVIESALNYLKLHEGNYLHETLKNEKKHKKPKHA